MKAMILAAGLGTRLRPLTLLKPKPLMPLANVPLIDRIIRYLKVHGVNEIVLNTHHLHQDIHAHLEKGQSHGINIDVRYEPEILGTGGGIRNTADFWDTDPFIVINGDIVTDINLGEAYTAHLKSGNIATMVLHNHELYNQVKIDTKLNITEIGSKSRPGRVAFTGIHIIEPDLIEHIPDGGFSDIISCYRKLISQSNPINAHIIESCYWRDIGTLPSYIQTSKDLLGKQKILLGDCCDIATTVEFKDWAIVGDGVSLEEGVKIDSSILWENIRVKKDVRITNSIVTSSKEVLFDIHDTVF